MPHTRQKTIKDSKRPLPRRELTPSRLNASEMVTTTRAFTTRNRRIRLPICAGFIVVSQYSISQSDNISIDSAQPRRDRCRISPSEKADFCGEQESLSSEDTERLEILSHRSHFE